MEKLERVKRLLYLHKTSPPAMSGYLLFAMTDFEIRALRAFDSWKKLFYICYIKVEMKMQVLFFFFLRQVSAFPAWMHFLNTHGE